MRILSWEVGVSPESVAALVSKGSVCLLLHRGVGGQGLHLTWVAPQGMQEIAYEAAWGVECGGHPSKGAGLLQSVSNCLCLWIIYIHTPSQPACYINNITKWAKLSHHHKWAWPWTVMEEPGERAIWESGGLSPEKWVLLGFSKSLTDF